MPFYRAFGLTLESERPVPGLVPRAAAAAVDTRIWFDTPPDPATRAVPPTDWHITPGATLDAPALRSWRLGDRAFRLRYADGTEFVVDRNGSNVWAAWAASSTLADTAVYLLGPVLGLVLRLRGLTCLHASAAAIGGGAVVFVGAPSAGKSTLAAALVRMGQRALADDIVAVDFDGDAAYARPAYEQLRLWPDSVARLYGSADALPRLTPTWDKRALELGRSEGFHDSPLPVSRIYLLEGRSPDAMPRIRPAGGRECLLGLLGNGYVNYLMDPRQRAEDFVRLCRLASHVPVRRLSVPDAAMPADRLRHAIVADCERR